MPSYRKRATFLDMVEFTGGRDGFARLTEFAARHTLHLPLSGQRLEFDEPEDRVWLRNVTVSRSKVLKVGDWLCWAERAKSLYSLNGQYAHAQYELDDVIPAPDRHVR